MRDRAQIRMECSSFRVHLKHSLARPCARICARMDGFLHSLYTCVGKLETFLATRIRKAVARKSLLGSRVICLVERPGFNSADVLRLDGFCFTKQTF